VSAIGVGLVMWRGRIAGSGVSERLNRGVVLVAGHLDPYERVELALLASVRPPLRRLQVWPRLERFLGFMMSRRRVVVLTNQRVLVLRAREAATADDWFDVQLDRRRVRADMVREYGSGLFTVKLMTSVRTQTAAFRRKEDAVVLARALGAPC
jgi:hypothetical protein